MNQNLNSAIDRMAQIERIKEELDEEYALLQKELLTDAEQKLADTKIKSVSYVTPSGNTAEVTVSDTVSVTAGELLTGIFGAVSRSMFTEEVKYTLKAPAKRILSAVWHGEYCKGKISDILDSLPCDDRTKKILSKKIKGADFRKDKKNLKTLAGLSETDASDIAYLLYETASYENLEALAGANGFSLTPEKLSGFRSQVNAAVNVSRSIKTRITAAESECDET
ncbi:MAG: hypothetical protein IJ642_12110 [Oscillospiraceae bacterium]|nr:hypothetical protein [Oscillospiraceae bacterium]